MPPTTIHSPPALDSFTPLAEHQSRTPTTFYNAKPVLHYHAVGLRAVAPSNNVSKLPIFPQSTGNPTESTPAEAASADPESQDSPASATVTEIVDAFINSENLTLFNHTKSIGVSIPYPTISLHAVQTGEDPADSSLQVQGLYMQLELSDHPDSNEDDDLDFVEITLFPREPSAEDSTTSDIQAIFEAVANCSNLHPNTSFGGDEEMDEDGVNNRIVVEGSVGYECISGLPGVQRGTVDGGLPPPFPGSGGWITAENVSEYFDEEGNWIGENNGEALGEGAGRVRTRDEADGEGVNGHGAEDTDDHKRQRAE